jgi:hypothetical protein
MARPTSRRGRHWCGDNARRLVRTVPNLVSIFGSPDTGDAGQDVQDGLALMTDAIADSNQRLAPVQQ